MKSIPLTFRVSDLIIPRSYNRQVQGMIYNTLKRIGGSGEAWHDFKKSSADYKFFTFSSLRGKRGQGVAENNQLHFIDKVYLDIRCAGEELSNNLILAFTKRKEYELFNQSLALENLSWESPLITSESVKIQMLSPLTMHRQLDSHYTYFYSPYDAEFSDEFNQNFRRKYFTFAGSEPDGDICLSPLSVNPADIYVTRYQKKDYKSGELIAVNINAWRGIYKPRRRQGI